MHGFDKHVCMLLDKPQLNKHPTASFCQRQISKFCELTLPCEWHQGTKLHIRSLKRFRLERERHLGICWVIWHPYSPIKFYWDCMQFIFFFAAFVYMPFQVFITCPNYYDPFILFTDGLCLLNICSRFISGYIDHQNKSIILEPKLIAKHYFKTVFLADFVGMLPLQLIRPFANCEYPTHTAMFLFKLLRVFSLRYQWKNVVDQFRLSYINYVALKGMVTAIMVFHWMTYVHHQVPNFCFHFYKMDNHFASWLAKFNIHTNSNQKIYSPYAKYATNLYLVSGLCIGAGYYTPLDQHLIPNFLLTASIGLIGRIFVTYLFATMLRLAIYTQLDSYFFKAKYQELEDNMAYMRLPQFLQRKIKLFLNYKFNERYYNEEKIQDTINEQIKQDISLYCCKNLLMNVPMFQDMPVALINAISFHLRRVLYMPGELIVKFGFPGDSLYLLSSGTVAVMNELGREVAHLRDGAFFGENALLHPGVLRTVTIIALEITEVYLLENKQFTECLQPYPHLKRKMDEITLKKHAALRKQRVILRQRKQRN